MARDALEIAQITQNRGREGLVNMADSGDCHDLDALRARSGDCHDLDALRARSAIARIADNVYLANFFAAKDRKKLAAVGITHILVCAQELPQGVSDVIWSANVFAATGSPHFLVQHAPTSSGLAQAVPAQRALSAALL